MTATRRKWEPPSGGPDDGLSALLALIDPEPEDTRDDIKERLAARGIDLDAAEARLRRHLALEAKLPR